MLRKIKNFLYFSVAHYFRFFATIRLKRWNPRIVVITGSNGKTTALHLLETQLGDAAKYSHLANSSFGIPFDILGLKRTTFSPFEWIWLVLLPPLHVFKKPYAEKIYIVEADCDRPGEGAFLSTLLKPEMTIWLSSARTHSQNFEKLVSENKFGTVEAAIAYEFGHFLEHTSGLAIVNADNPLILQQLHRTKAKSHELKIAELLESCDVKTSGTEFKVHGVIYHVPYLLPRETSYAIAASIKTAEYFEIPTSDLSKLSMPPGRSSVFQGIKNTTIIDSSYNANVDSIQAVLRMTEDLPSQKKWLILGDLTEQGVLEREEHEKIGRFLKNLHFQRIVLVGPRLARYTLPILQNQNGGDKSIVSFTYPKDALRYLNSSLEGEEMLIFKGARFLEGIIEHLLQNPDDAAKLCRREKVWRDRRAQWQL